MMEEPITPEAVSALLAQHHDGSHMTGPEVAKFLGVSEAAIRKWRERGDGPRFHQPAGSGTQATYDAVDVASFAIRWGGKGSRKGK